MLQSSVYPVPLHVGITTLLSRISHLQATLDSLMVQTKMPSKILLCLPRWFEREQCRYDRLHWLSDYAPTLEVVDCEDALRVHGKPEVFNIDQGSQFTSDSFTGGLNACVFR